MLQLQASLRHGAATQLVERHLCRMITVRGFSDVADWMPPREDKEAMKARLSKAQKAAASPPQLIGTYVLFLWPLRTNVVYQRMI
jgi:hypothetical protein